MSDVEEDAPLMYLVFTRMPGESYRRRLRSLLLFLCGVFRALINSLVCWFFSVTEHVNFLRTHNLPSMILCLAGWKMTWHWPFPLYLSFLPLRLSYKQWESKGCSHVKYSLVTIKTMVLLCSRFSVAFGVSRWKARSIRARRFASFCKFIPDDKHIKNYYSRSEGESERERERERESKYIYTRYINRFHTNKSIQALCSVYTGAIKPNNCLVSSLNSMLAIWDNQPKHEKVQDAESLRYRSGRNNERNTKAEQTSWEKRGVGVGGGGWEESTYRDPQCFTGRPQQPNNWSLISHSCILKTVITHPLPPP